MASIDLTIFNDQTTSPCSTKQYKTCISIKRLLSCLKYYKALNIPNNIQNKEIFLRFMGEIYKEQILDDFHHLVKHHQHQLEEIRRYAINVYKFNKCDINSCHFTLRHFRVNDNNNTKEMDTNYTFYAGTMDSLHLYLFHLFDLSLRTPQDTKNDENVEEKYKENDHFDDNLHRLNKRASKARKITTKFQRYDANSSKFNIKTADQYGDSISIKGTTFLGKICHKLRKIDEKGMLKFVKLVKDEDYDSESVDADIHINNGNISKHINDAVTMNVLIDEFNKAHRMYIIYILQLFCISIATIIKYM